MHKLLQYTDITIPPGNVICVGRNYMAHAKELGNDIPKDPVFFLKPTSALVPGGGEIELPRNIGQIDHEIELAVLISKTAKNIPEDKALEYVMGYAVFLDLTAREVQSKAKEKGLPWFISKSYDGFAPISDIRPAEKVVYPGELSMELKINGGVRQRGNTKDMTFSTEVLISRLSEIVTLEQGDIIATGTPAGVGPIHPGDKLDATIEDVGELHVNFV